MSRKQISGYRRLPPELMRKRDEKIIELSLLGYSANAIAPQFKLTDRGVEAILLRYGTHKRKGKTENEETAPT